ncbi:hypothetical protein SAMN05443575_3191 [Jatrophihabitans endophyticus]|uniref:Xylose isomerase-like TIM barrel domain-containing protein n=1 Tax=Jatrophihabitans endophyticus TaxID=1206085 RepID=A0A1M5PV29_9ACTN|nr:TIM barrel protein [Jatrophihabitans endophyticus]SHH05133.1 hypothetical protein SAMN05443575_3191 [Jatrophihabitans endophyticus]
MTSTRWPLGICRLAWPTDLGTAAREAARLRFAHLDVFADDPDPGLLPTGVRLSRTPRAGCAWPAPPRGADRDAEIDRLRRIADPYVEPWAGSLFGDDDAVRDLVARVPAVRVVVDTGHVTAWGGDLGALLPLAHHVQLRQAAPGRAQLPADRGTVDFAAVFAVLERCRYDGLLSIEYFDLPRLGWPLTDPVGHAVQLAEHVRPMLQLR